MNRLRFLLLLGVTLFPVSSAYADEEAVSLGPAEIRSVLAEFGRAYRAKDGDARASAVSALAPVDDPKVAEKLLRALRTEKDPVVLGALFDALARQEATKGKVMKKVMAWLANEAEEQRKRVARGRVGVRIDPRTGEPDLDSEEGRLVLAETRARGEVLCEAVRCTRLLAKEAPPSAEAVVPFLQDPLDDLVVETLGAIGQWGLESALPNLLDLYRMYPTEVSYETGEVVHAAGTDATAKQAWMAIFGHPDKRRARPRVHAALQECLETLTGRGFESPEELESWLHAKRRGRSAA